MGRIHLFEFEDQSWCPTFLRNYATDFLQFLSNKTSMFKPAVPLLEEALSQSNTTTIVDLGSGGGGSLITLNKILKKKIPGFNIIMTDYYPNIPAFKHTQKEAGNFSYETRSIDARKVPAELEGLRTMFLVFHHFKPGDAKLILQNAINSQRSIAIFEAQERSIPSLIAMIFSPITALVITPFIRPFKFGRILFTYFIPIVPLIILWDGIVSSLRTYSVKEMNEIISDLDNSNSYTWKTGKIKSGPSKLLYLIGTRN